MGFTKLDEDVFDSSLTSSGPVPFAVFMLLLSKAKPPDGIAAVAPSVIASRLRIQDEECLKAFALLQAPDPESRTPDRDGRRIERVDGGWLILNYWKYRERRDPDVRREQNREAARRSRDRKRSSANSQPASATISHDQPMQKQKQKQKNEDVGSSLLIPSTTTILVGPGSVPSEARHEARALTEATAVALVFDYWRERTNHPRAVWNEARRRHLLVRLREEPGDLGMKVAGLCQAVDGALQDPLFNGSEKGRAYLEFENIFIHKGRDRIEKLQGVARGESAPAAGIVRQDDLEDGNKRAVVAAIQKSRAMKGLPEGGA